MKKTIYIALFLITGILTGCSSENPYPEQKKQINQQETKNKDPLLSIGKKNGFTKFNNKQLELKLSENNTEPLTEKEKEGLIYMREEEKLAHDLYDALNQKWNRNIFSNISSSELTHTNAIQSLLIKYSLKDPTMNEKGKFSNPSLKSLYDELITKGGESLTEALKVGALVGEIDIIDLKKHLEETKNQDLVLVYSNLMKGSRNHLRAFVRNLDKQGVSYNPQRLKTEEFNQIIKESIER